MICLASLRHGLRWPPGGSCIQDAFFALVKRWLAERGIAPRFFGISWNSERPRRDPADIEAAEWVFIFSSNEWTFYEGGVVVNPLFIAGSNERLARYRPLLSGKRIALFSIDAMDTEALILGRTLAGCRPAEFHFISEAAFPTTCHSLRYGQLLQWRSAAKARDLSYYGTTKQRAPGGMPSGDARYAIMRALLSDPALDSYLAGNHFGSRKANARFLAAPWAELARARATICFHWPGCGGRLTGRYHEALAMGMIPLVHEGYDTERQLAKAPWQRIRSAPEAKARILELRAPEIFAARFAELEESYRAAAPSDESQYQRLCAMLEKIGAADSERRPAMAAPAEAESAAWQRGYDIERLRALAAPFKARHKPLVHGAFGLIKERDIAEALAEGRLAWTGSPPAAAAIVSYLKAESTQQDFAQREIRMPAGAVSIKALAALSDHAGAKILDAIIARAKGAACYLEIFEEDEIARAAAAAAGFAYFASKVMAGSEIKGLYFAGLPDMPPLPAADKATLKILDPCFLSSIALEAIKQELREFSQYWAQHYSSYNKRKSWEAFALQGYADDPGFIIKPAEMSKAWKDANQARLSDRPRLTDAAPRFRSALAACARLWPPGECDRIRFMRLRAKGGELSRHADITDREAGTADGMVARLHIPIETSPAVRFQAWDARGQWHCLQAPAGSLFYLDQRKPHAVINSDPALDRVHLVVDCLSNEALRQRLAA